jgi:hypothetical protein
LSERDHYTKYGAAQLALTIQNFWHSRGHRGVVVERFELWDGVWGVRSTLVNGLPAQEVR